MRRMVFGRWQSVGLIMSVLCVAQAQAAVDAKTTVNTVCVACHGADGNGIAATFPKLAGQTTEYLAKQMADFLAGRRKNEVMAPFMTNLKATNLNQLAAYFTALQPSSGKSEQPALITAGEKIYMDGNVANGVPGCVGCHGPKALGDALNPRLAGQYPSYMAAQIQAFRAGTRNNDKARVMRNAVEHLSDAEAAAVVEYLAAQ